MPSFHEVRLPEDIERGSSGGPRFNTTVMTLASGHEKRNVNWSRSRGRWDVGYGIQYIGDLETVIEFFYARQGRGYGFRFKDWSDYKIGEVGTPHNFTTTSAGIGAGPYQVYKVYTSGSTTFSRKIIKLVSGTISVYLNGVVVNPADYVTDLNAGTITFDSAPANGQNLGIICEFDVPVRFDTDELNVSMEVFNAGTVPSIPIIELRA